MNASRLRLRVAWTVTLALAPVWIAQGLWARKRTLRMPPADGPHTGRREARGRRRDDTRAPLHLLVIGESTAAGVGANSHDEALAGKLADVLAQETGRDVCWHALGRSGAKSADVLEALVPQMDAIGHAIDLVFVVLGVNDTKGLRRTAQWRRDMTALVRAIRTRTSAHVVLVGVPKMGEFQALAAPLRWAMGARAALLDDELRKIAGKHERVWHVRTQAPTTHDAMAVDGFHPSALGYALWAESLVRAVRESGLELDGR